MAVKRFTLIFRINMMNVKNIITATRVTATCTSAAEILNTASFVFVDIFFVVSCFAKFAFSDYVYCAI